MHRILLRWRSIIDLESIGFQSILHGTAFQPWFEIRVVFPRFSGHTEEFQLIKNKMEVCLVENIDKFNVACVEPFKLFLNLTFSL